MAINGLGRGTNAVGEGAVPSNIEAGNTAVAPHRWTWHFYASAAVLGSALVAAALGPTLTGYNWLMTDLTNRLVAPGGQLSTGEVSLLGTDQLGRDLLAQTLQGARVSMLVGLTTVVLAGSVGIALGVVAGYFGGVIDAVTMRVADVQLAFPSILLAILIASVLGPSVANVIITLSITRWVAFARVARGITLSSKKLDFVDSARVLGASHWRIISRHVFPSSVTSLLVLATVEFGLVIITEAALSFLGLGAPLSSPSWGLIIANGRDYLDTAWWLATVPGAALAVVVVAVGLLGDELRDRLDPARC